MSKRKSGSAADFAGAAVDFEKDLVWNYLDSDRNRLMTMASMVRSGAMDKAISMYMNGDDDKDDAKRSRAMPMILGDSVEIFRVLRPNVYIAFAKAFSDEVSRKVNAYLNSSGDKGPKENVIKNMVFFALHKEAKSKLPVDRANHKRIDTLTRMGKAQYDRLGKRLETWNPIQPLLFGHFEKGAEMGEFKLTTVDPPFTFKVPVPTTLEEDGWAFTNINNNWHHQKASIEFENFPTLTLWMWVEKAADAPEIMLTTDDWLLPETLFPKGPGVVDPDGEAPSASPSPSPPPGSGRSSRAAA